MTARNQALFWSLSFLGFLSFIYIFKSILLPFVLGIAVAYLLNPLVNAFRTAGIGRKLATFSILGGFLFVVAALLAVLAPVLSKQMTQLINDFPQYLDQVNQALTPYAQKVSALLGQENSEDIQGFLKDQSGMAINIAQNIAGGLAKGGQLFFDLVSVIVLMPVVAYFMMVEWNTMTDWVKDLMPRDHKKTILNLLSQMDQKISGFVRGQISVAVILAVLYAVALTIAGLKYGFLIGLVSGLLAIIPMVGSVIGLIVSVGVAWFQSGDLTFVAIIAGIFLAGQLLEGNVLSPKIVGESVGMHPLWVFFALMAGGSLFGILGMLLAVPVAAVAGVLLAFGIAQYKLSALYKGKVKPKSKKAKANAK